MKIKELKDLSEVELLDKEKTLFVELSKLNVARYTGSVDKPHKFALIRKDIARIRTLLSLLKKGVAGRGPSNQVNQEKDK